MKMNDLIEFRTWRFMQFCISDIKKIVIMNQGHISGSLNWMKISTQRLFMEKNQFMAVLY